MAGSTESEPISAGNRAAIEAEIADLTRLLN